LDAEKAQALATQFQPVNDPSEPYVIEVSEALRAYFILASEPHLTNPAEIQDAASSTAGDILPSQDDIQRFIPQTLLCTHMEARPRDFHL